MPAEVRGRASGENRRDVHLTVKNRILLHLMERGRTLAPEASPNATQEGIARAAGIALRHVPQYVRPLVRDGLLEERTAHVEGIRQRRRVYALTDAGRLEAIRLRELVKPQPVSVKDETGVHPGTVGSVLAAAKGRGSLLEILRRAESGEPVDPAALAAPPTASFIEMTAGKPDVQRFVGRRRELDVVTRDLERSQFLVVRGVAGIGKTWLAAEACRRLRGSRNLFWHRVRPWDTLQSILLRVGEFLAALGKPALRAVVARGHVDRAPEILRRDLTGTRSVLVFDDVHEATDVTRGVFRMLLEALETATDVRVILLSRKAVPVYDRRDTVLRKLVEEIDLPGLDPEDVAAYLSMDGGPVVSAPFRRDVLRHPLLLELFRARREAPALAGRDVRRYIEETLVDELAAPERRAMAVASLYEVPVPRDALTADATRSHDVLLALENRGLLRTVSDGRFETHDAIREAFRGLLAPMERTAYGGFAVDRLRGLAADASAEKRYALCADYLSNALRLAESPAEQVEIAERLGDAQARMGDLLALSVSYRQAIRGSTDPLVLARLRRKLAAALCAHAEFDGALAEAETASRCLGDAESVEAAWLELIRSRISNKRFDFVAGRDHGERALQGFRAQREVRGEAEADLELGDATSLLGTLGPGGTPLADAYYEEGLRLAESLEDSALTVMALVGIAARVGHRHGDAARVTACLAEASARAEVLDDPFVTMAVLVQRGWAQGLLRGDYEGSLPDLREAVRIAREVHDANAAAENLYIFAGALRLAGRVSEARPLLEEAGAQMARLGIDPGRPLFVLSWAAECCLVEADREGFFRILTSLESLGLTEGAWVDGRPIRGFACVLGGDWGGARLTFERGLQLLARTAAEEEQFAAMRVSQLELYYAAALEAMGATDEAAEHHARAVDVFRAHHYTGRLVTADARQRGIVEGIRRIWAEGRNRNEPRGPGPAAPPPRRNAVAT